MSIQEMNARELESAINMYNRLAKELERLQEHISILLEEVK